MTTFEIAEAAFAVFGAWVVALFLLAAVFGAAAARAMHADEQRLEATLEEIPYLPDPTPNNVLPVQLATARQRTARRTRDADHHS